MRTAWRRETLESRAHAEANGAFLDWMEMHVLDAARRLAGKTRGVEVVDVAHCCVEDVEQVGVEPQTRRDGVADAGIDRVRRLRADGVVFDERARTEVAVAQFARESVT